MPKLSLSDPITMRLPEDVLAEIEQIAETCDRTRSWVMVRALKLYLASEGADILAVRKGREQVAEGDVQDILEHRERERPALERGERAREPGLRAAERLDGDHDGPHRVRLPGPEPSVTRPAAGAGAGTR